MELEKDFIENVVEDVYIKISEKFGLTTGDVSPEDSLLADKFKESLIRYIEYNRNEREKLISEGFKNVDNDFYLKSNGDGTFIVARIDLEKININLTYYSEEEIKDEVSKHINNWEEFDENNKDFIALCIYKNIVGYEMLTLDLLESQLNVKYKESFEGVQRDVKKSITLTKPFIINGRLYVIEQLKGNKFIFYSGIAPTEDEVLFYLEEKDWNTINNFYKFFKISKNEFEEMDLIGKISLLIEYFDYLEIDENSRQLRYSDIVKKINITL